MIESEFRKLMVLPTGAHEIAVMRPDRSSDLKEATARVSALAEGYETMNWRELKPVIARILDLADSQMIILIIITYTAVAMVVLNAMLMSVFERIRELGIMKAVGVTPWQLMLLIYAEMIIQVAVASIIAFLSGWSLSLYFQKNGIDLSSRCRWRLLRGGCYRPDLEGLSDARGHCDSDNLPFYYRFPGRSLSGSKGRCYSACICYSP